MKNDLPYCPADIETYFANPGKTYFGVRYPDGGTIRPPLCVVTVVPDDGQAYLLPPKLELHDFAKELKNAKSKDTMREMARFSESAERFSKAYRYEWNVKDDYKIGLRDAKNRQHQLAFAILYDMTGDEKLASEMYGDFAKIVLSKQSELLFNINGPKEILERYAAEIVMIGLQRING